VSGRWFWLTSNRLRRMTSSLLLATVTSSACRRCPLILPRSVCIGSVTSAWYYYAAAVVLNHEIKIDCVLRRLSSICACYRRYWSQRADAWRPSPRMQPGVLQVKDKDGGHTGGALLLYLLWHCWLGDRTSVSVPVTSSDLERRDAKVHFSPADLRR